jgi:hypothetical protein
VEITIVVVGIHVKGLEEHVTPKLVPLIIPKIGTITHTFEVFKTRDTILKDTPIVERPQSKHVPLAKLVDTISEQVVEDLAARVKHVVLSD